MRTYLVTENQKITSSTLLLTLKRDDKERPLSFQPGQYAAISFEHGRKKSVTRCFSIVSAPTDQDVLQFSMRVRGHFTTALSQLNPGDIVNVSGPFGGFVFDVATDKQAVFMAGGIGITPFMSIMRHLDKLSADNHATLLYSCTTQDDVPFAEELLAINKRHPNLRTIFVIGKGPTDKLPQEHIATGFISEELLDHITNKDYKSPRFFICGPPVFMKAMSGMVFKKDVPKERVMTEAFTQSSPKQTSILRSWPANVYALGAVGLVFGGFMVMVSDLLKTLPSSTTYAPTKKAPFILTNARQKQLDQLVNTIPPSPSVITSPTANKTTTSTTATPTTVKSTPPSFAPVYLSAPPRTTTSAPPP